MFHQEGSDSGYVKVVLFDYDSITPGILPYWSRVDTIAFSSGYMHQEVTSFTPFSLPINYLNVDTPAFMHIYFSTSKTVAEAFLGTPQPYQDAYPGTTLWLDDVHISTGGTGTVERPVSSLPPFYPDPATDLLYFRNAMGSRVRAATLTDLRGQVVLLTTSVGSAPLYIGDLAPGLYLVHCTLSTGKGTIDKLIVQ